MRRDVGQAALAVVGQQDGVVVAQQTAVLVKVGGQHFRLGRMLEVRPDDLLLASDQPKLDGGRDRGVLMQVGRDPRASRPCVATMRPASSAPTTDSKPARAPTAVMLRATLAAPPSRSSVVRTRSTGTGASGEMRSTSPNQ